MLGAYPPRLHLIAAPVSGLLSWLRDWPTTSQLQARRNALVASTACARRRAEREEVADFLESRARPTYTVTTTVRHAAHG